jgi:photosystem II stability/assembly factor-like uncharacterized protein
MAKAGLVYIGTYDGMVTLSDPGGSGRWRQIDHGLQGHAVSVLPLDALRLLAATPELGIQISTDGGMGWQPVSEARAVALAGSIETLLYAALENGDLLHSSDGGQSWQPLSLPPAASVAAGQAVDLLLVQPGRVLLARGTQLWASSKAGAAWQPQGPPLPTVLHGLLAAPEPDAPLWAVAGGLLYRDNHEQGWIAQPAPATDAAYTGALTLLPGKTAVLLAAAQHANGAALLARSEDLGTSWQPASSSVPLEGHITLLEWSGQHPDHAWAGTNAGQVLLTSDRGRSWHLITQGHAPLRSLAAARLA